MTSAWNDNSPGILFSKLRIPRSIAKHVPRPHLIARLNEGMAGRATFLTAPAGYGKTTLVSEWARQTDVPVGWLSLDEKDNDLVRFWRYVMASIERAIGELPNSVHTAADALNPGQFEPFLVNLLNELNRLQNPLALIWDDWHLIAAPEIADSVSFFLEYLPPSVHLLFASRALARFAKARWRNRDWIHGINADEMRFDLRETVDFFRIYAGRELRREQIEQCLAESEGWVTGLKLIALSWRYGGRTDADKKPFSPDGGSLEQYLLEEVFEALDERTRRFLLDVSVVERMNGSLCEAVGGENGSLKLAELADLGLFLIPLDDYKEWYRFHHLFGAFLRDRMKLQDPSRMGALFQTAAE